MLPPGTNEFILAFLAFLAAACGSLAVFPVALKYLAAFFALFFAAFLPAGVFRFTFCFLLASAVIFFSSISASSFLSGISTLIVTGYSFSGSPNLNVFLPSLFAAEAAAMNEAASSFFSPSGNTSSSISSSSLTGPSPSFHPFSIAA